MDIVSYALFPTEIEKDTDMAVETGADIVLFSIRQGDKKVTIGIDAIKKVESILRQLVEQYDAQVEPNK